HRQSGRSDPGAPGRLRCHRSRIFDNLPRYCPAVPLAVGHGIAAIVRPIDARDRQGQRPAKLRPRRRARRRVKCGKLLMPGATEPPNSGAGIYFDGVSSTRRDVIVELAPASLQISGLDGHSWTQWPYDDIEELTAPDGILRLGRRG